MRFSTLRFLVKEGFRSLRQNFFMSAASVLVLVSCLLITGFAYLVYENVEHTFDWAEQQNVITAYAKEDATDEDIANIKRVLKRNDNVAQIEFVSKEELLERYRDEFDDLAADNPLPDAFVISFVNLEFFDETIAEIKAIDGIIQVDYNQALSSSLLKVRNIVLMICFWVIILLLVVSLFIIANTIKLTVYSRRREIAIMRSVGATPSFVRFPFVVEGVLLGLIAGAIAYGLVFGGYTIAQRNFTFGMFGLMSFSAVWLKLLVGFVVGGTLTGVLGSTISIRRYLREKSAKPPKKINRKAITRVISALTVAALLLATPVPVQKVSAAKSVDDLRTELAELQKKEKELKAELEKLGDSIDDQKLAVQKMKQQVENLEAQVDAYKAQRTELENKIAVQNANIEALNTQITSKEARMDEIMAKLKKRVKAITQTGQYSAFQMLMSTEDYADYLLKTQILNCISKHDQALRDEAAAEKAAIEAARAEIESEKLATEQDRAEVLTIEEELNAQFEQLDALYVTAKNKENELKKQQNTYQQKLQQIQKSEADLDREIAALLKNPTSQKYGGKMYWPAPTIKRISSGYGKRGSGYHYAIDISNGKSLGEPIVAAADGVVLKVQKLHYSYGNFCMIDHGLDENGVRIVTLYAHMRYVPEVTVGQKVYGGTTKLGQIGNTGESYGAHLHFEVREDNVRVNPIGKGYVVQPK